MTSYLLLDEVGVLNVIRKGSCNQHNTLERQERTNHTELKIYLICSWLDISIEFLDNCHPESVTFL